MIYYCMQIVRDFARDECIGNVAELATKQRLIVNTIVKWMPENGWEGPVEDKMKQLKQYVMSSLTHHVSEALAVRNSPDMDAIAWLETSNDPFLGFVVSTTAICLGNDELMSWASKFEHEGDKRIAARLMACAAITNLAGIGMHSSAGDTHSAGMSCLERAGQLLGKSSAINDEDSDQKERWCTFEFHICRELQNRIGQGDLSDRYTYYRDRAVLLG